MAQKTVSLTFASDLLPDRRGRALGSGQREGVHFLVDFKQMDHILETLDRWFEDRDDVILVAHGRTRGLARTGFVILEWEEVRIDPDFLSVLKTDEAVTAYSCYIREPEDVQEDDEDDDFEDDEED